MSGLRLGKSRAPASGGNSAAASVILLKPSISREMKSLFQAHFLQLKSIPSRFMCSYMCVYMYACGVRALSSTSWVRCC